MRFNPDIHRRQSIRLRGFDYGSTGAYFVTIVTQGRECVFGDVVGGHMVLNDVGRMVWDVWNDIPGQYPGVDVDTFVVMPNHAHGIIWIRTDGVGAGPRACPGQEQSRHAGQPQGVAPTPMSLFDAVHRFKSFTTARYRFGVAEHGWPPFPGRLWQRNYWEHVIRNEQSLHAIRQYIADNPAIWETDDENPKRKNPPHQR